MKHTCYFIVKAETSETNYFTSDAAGEKHNSCKPEEPVARAVLLGGTITATELFARCGG